MKQVQEHTRPVTMDRSISQTQILADWANGGEVVRIRMGRNLHRFYELDIGFNRAQSDYIEAMQGLAREFGLPAIHNDGTWQR